MSDQEYECNNCGLLRQPTIAGLICPACDFVNLNREADTMKARALAAEHVLKTINDICGRRGFAAVGIAAGIGNQIGQRVSDMIQASENACVILKANCESAEQERDQLKAELQQAREAAGRLLKSQNFIYCVQYLKNGDERIRAIRLVIDATGLSLSDSKSFVESLHTPLPLVDCEKPKITCPECRTDFDNDDLRLKSGICPVCRAILERIEKEKTSVN